MCALCLANEVFQLDQRAIEWEVAIGDAREALAGPRYKSHKLKCKTQIDLQFKLLEILLILIDLRHEALDPTTDIPQLRLQDFGNMCIEDTTQCFNISNDINDGYQCDCLYCIDQQYENFLRGEQNE